MRHRGILLAALLCASGCGDVGAPAPAPAPGPGAGGDPAGEEAADPSTGPAAEGDPPAGAPSSTSVDKVRALLQKRGIAAREVEVWFSAEGRDVIWFLLPGAKAPAAWDTLRKEAAGLGLWPVVLGPPEEAAALGEGQDPGNLPSAVLAEAAKLDAAKVLERRAGDDPETYAETRGDWPEEPEVLEEMTVHLDPGSGEPFPDVLMALVPAKHGYEVPAWLSFGGWNDCPAPAEHVAVLRSWNERFGADLAGLSGDTLELRNARVPGDREALLELAREQFRYCADRVQQGYGTLDALAAGIGGSRAWSFWWD